MDQREMEEMKLVNEFGMIEKNILGIEQVIKKQIHLENLVDKFEWTERFDLMRPRWAILVHLSGSNSKVWLFV